MDTPSVKSSHDSRLNRYAWLVIALGALLAYHNTFSVPFLFDDNSSIQDNPSIRSLATAWSPPATGGLTVSGRPFLNFTLAVNQAVSGQAVWSYHLLNLLIHASAGCVLFGLVRRTLTRPILAVRFGADATLLALATALIWTLHPLQTESVTYIVQRAESLVGLMYLLTLWCFVCSVETGASKVWAALAWIACLLGMATKEVMVTAPVLVALYDRILVAGSWREVWTRRGRFHLALAATWLLLAWLVLGTGGRGGTAGFGGEISPWSYAVTQIGAVVHYLRLAVWPQPLVFDYGRVLADGWREVWWQALLLFPLLISSLWASWRGRPVGYLGVFFFAVLAPSSSFVPVVTQTMSEHRIYLPLAAVAALCVTGLYAWLGRKSLVLFALLAVALGVATVQRNRDYRTELAIWEDTALKQPGNARAFAALGAIHQEAGRREAALSSLQEAVRLDPRSAEARNNLGNAWMKSGHWAEAIQCFQDALQLKPADPFALNNLGNALLQSGRVLEAIEPLSAAVRVKPDFAEARFNLANTLARTDHPDAALPHYLALLRLRPADGEAHSNYGDVLVGLGRFTEGIAELQTAVKLQPGNADLQNNLGSALARSGRPAEALPYFREALRLRPDFTGAKQNIERATRTLEAVGRDR